MKPSNTVIVSSEYIREKEQQIERLQEQLESDEMALNEAQEIIAELKAQINEANTTIISLYNMGIKNNIPEVMSIVLDYVRKYGTTEEHSVNNI